MTITGQRTSAASCSRSSVTAKASAEAVYRRADLLQPDRAVGRRQARLERQPGRRQRVGDPHRQQHACWRRSPVGDEPQSVALDPNNRYAYVANAAGSTVTVIRINNADAPAASAPSVEKTLTTGAEPWNIVISPDGKRVFVANSGQDTITVINAADAHDHRPGEPAQQPVQRSRPQAPLPAARPGGDARTTRKLYVTRFLSFTKAGGKQGDGRRQGGRGLPAEHQHQRRRASPATQPARRDPAGAAGHRLRHRFQRRRRARPTRRLPEPAAEHRASAATAAYLPNIAASPERPAAVPNSTRGLRQPDRRGIGGSRGRRAARSTCTWARATRSLARRSCSSPTPGRSPSPTRAAPATPTSSRPAAICWSSSMWTPTAPRASPATPTRPATST